MDDLRKKAQQHIDTSEINIKDLSQAELQHMVEELKIHQVELQMQNDELRSKTLEIEIARRKYFNLFDKALTAFMVLDNKGIILELNFKAAELFEKTKERAVKSPFISLLDKDSMSDFYENFELAVKKKQNHSFELNLRKGISTQFIEITISMHIENTFLVQILDLTERKKTEKVLKDNENKLKSIINNYPNGSISLINRRYNFEITGGSDFSKFKIDASSFINKPVQKMLGNGLAEILINYVQKAFKGYSNSYEVQFNEFIYKNTVSPIISENNIIDNVLVISSNITEQKKAEMALNERMKELRGLYSVSKIVNKTNNLFESILQQIVEVLPPAMQFPEITYAKIQINNQVFNTANYIENSHFLESQIKQADSIVGSLIIGYTHISNLHPDEIFLKEEHDFIYAVAEQINIVIERFEVLNTLKKSEENFRLLFEFMPIGISISDKNGKLLISNKEAQRLLEKTNDEQTKQKIDATEWKIIRTDGTLMPPEEFASVKALKENRLVENVEMGLVKENNKITWINVTAAPKPFGDEIIIAYIDITDKIIANQELKKSEKKHRFLTENITDVIWIMDISENKLIYISPSIEKLRGYTPEEVLEQPNFNKLSDTSLQKTEELLKQRISEFYRNPDKQLIYIDEIEQLCKDGSTVWTEVINHFQVNNENQHIEVIGVSRNINKRKKAEFEFRKLLIAIEQSPVNIVITDINGNIEFVNPSFYEITGYSFEEVIGKNPRILQSNKTPNSVYVELWQTIISGKIWKGEFINKRKNGELYYEEAIISPIKNQNGVISNYIAIKIDISQKKYQQELIKLNNERLQHLLALSQTKETKMEIILEHALEIALLLTKSTIGYIYRAIGFKL